MQPKIVKRDAFTVMGISTRSVPEETDYNDLWMNQYMLYHDQIQPFSTDNAYYGVSLETDEEGVIEYIAGMAVENVKDVPEGLVLRAVSAARDAVFECKVKTLGETWDYIFTQWLPASQYEYDRDVPSFEYYPPDTENDESPASIHIPIKDKG